MTQHWLKSCDITYPKLGVKHYNLGAFWHDVVACSGLEKVGIHVALTLLCHKKGIKI